ncbi:MAG: polysaccharide biosynthesis tyrosine autokinase [Bacteroidales bacterium]|jgi:capsular exopolysaccharide synthesis family protein|nr:polysaccharide biosynthesis tyrosine autokinase [Bacteroidales bacterium]MDI9575440.1 polysaccharide biosynthesis tyrosine autokinase [Bacteroidota bacterium]HHW60210.1 polysaccharide biosynthesis tyrosine autokinase [Bacteroidales bacterium]
MDDQYSKNKYVEEDTINLREILEKYFRHWKLILACVIIALVIGFLFLKSKVPIYESSATVIVKDEKSGSLSDELSVFSDLGIMTQRGNIYNEIEILKSRKLLSQVVKELSLNLTIYNKANFLKPDKYYYKNSPINIDFNIPIDEIIKPTTLELSLNDKNFKIYETYIDSKGKKISEFKGKYKFGDPIETSLGIISINKTQYWNEKNIGDDIIINITSIDNTVNNYKNNLTIETVNRDASAISIKINGPNKELNDDFLNTLILQHQYQAISDKNIIAINTSRFIDERMKVIETELSNIESMLQSFMTQEKYIDLNISVQNILAKESNVEKDLINSYIQLKLAEQIKDYLDKHKDLSSLLPANLGVENDAINKMTNDYNQLVLQRNNLLLNSSAENPLVTKIDNQLLALRASLNESLNNLITSLKIQTQSLKTNIDKYSSNLASMPASERRYRDILRQQQIKENLYIYLMQKREETEIAMAATVSNIKLVDPAYSSPNPIKPKKTASMFIALLIGLFFPILLIYVRNLFDNKIHTPQDLEFLDIPILASIPVNKSNDLIVIKDNVKHHLAEAFRTLRSNLEFIITNKKEKGNTIFVTSTIPGEGKTFISLNLAVSYTLLNAKVLILELDLRAPRIAHYLNMPESKGISDYLKDDNLDINDIIIHSVEYQNLDYINAGTIPPNPSELLQRPRLAELFNFIQKEYDYIVVDNAPIGLVVDSLSIISYADIILYVARAEYLDKRALGFTYNFIKNKNVKNIALVLNATKARTSSYYDYAYYNYNYYYQYSHDVQSTDNKIKKLFYKFTNKK